MLVNKQAVKQTVAEKGKQMSKEFLEALNRRVYEMITRACANSGNSKRLNGSELL